jgi:hypothetical protein
MNNYLKASILLFKVLILTACAGGGGGGGGGSSAGGVTVTPFTSWSAIQPNSTVQATGGLSTYFDYSPSGVGPLASATTASFTGSYGPIQSDGYVYLQSATISSNASGNPSVSFDKAAGDTIAVATNGALAGIATVMIKADSSAVAIAAEPQALGWNYQTYGIWVSGDTAGFAGAVSVGSPTAVTGIPSTGSANFSGNASGFYLDSTGRDIYFTTANMTATTNFATRTISFSTSSTAISTNLTNFVAPSTYGIGNLNMTGTLNYAAGTNSISGAVTASGASPNSLSGTANAKFFGPTANEIGGTYGLSNAGTSERLVGGFGGKR